ncbi:MAG: tryptophan--tRNA ligase [Rhizobiales bacterium]|nr:tryptophan--tRNA ligase [Hyphomicrobiales bacterium]NRB15259.1 tryptophan--tRNA ligase [Hyphomicrobiales bacterium]
MTQFTKRVFSGIKPSGKIHLGNYLGAIQKFVKLQEDKSFENIYCVVDMHAITVKQDPKILRKRTLELTATYLASGVDPEQSIIFNQSRVAQHAELGWIFNCIARVGWMNRMTQFKDKAGKNSENVSLGLLAYPSLMAADILLYNATHVPVGDDQKQHLELCRDIAQKFNNDYADEIKQHGFGDQFFCLTEPLINFGNKPVRVMSLRDGSKKMSSSAESDMTRINMNDDSEMLAKKLKKAKTDQDALPSEMAGLEGRPEARNLISIFAALDDTDSQSVLNQFGGQQFREFKAALIDLAVAEISPIGDEINRLMKEEAYIDQVLKDGADRARALAEPLVQDVKKIIGFMV